MAGPTRQLRPVEDGAPAPRPRAAQRTEGPAPETMLMAIVFALVAFGVVMVYSASSSRALLDDGDPLAFVKRQMIFAVIGLGAFWLCRRMDARALQRLAGPAVGVSLFLLVVVLIPGVGQNINGSRRWLPMPLFGQVQPAEIAKVALILWIAAAVARDPRRLTRFEGMIPYLAMTALMSVLILAEPDMGTASTLAVIALGMLLVGGAQPKHIAGVLGLLFGLSALAIAMAPYRRERMLAFLDPMSDPGGIGFQTLQAQVALGSGGIKGVGLGDGLQKAFYLPEAHTDMILATVGEELGVIGVVAVLGALAMVALLGYRIALRAPDHHQRLLATGLATLIAVQALDNAGAVLGVMPITGVPLPFVSYGGSNLIVLLAAVGILVNISRNADRHTRRQGATAEGADRRGRDGRPRDAGAGGGRSAARAGG